jgi:hypothetical protein
MFWVSKFVLNQTHPQMPTYNHNFHQAFFNASKRILFMCQSISKVNHNPMVIELVKDFKWHSK